MNRRDFIKRLGALALTAMAEPMAMASKAAESKPVKRRLTILHTNDVHSHIDPFPADDPRYPNLGGYSRRHAYINKVRNEGNEVLVFESGDIFQGTPYFNFYGGKLEISLMNKMGVDAVTIGNHEFDNGLERLCDRMTEANFPFINSNYTFTNDRAKQLVKPYKIFEKCGIKVGVLGLGVETKGLITDANLMGTTYNDPIVAAQQTADHLRAEGCQLVIALTHIGYQMPNQVDDCDLARQTRGIDMILGGHTHTFLSEPDYIKNLDGKKVLVNQVGYCGINVGRIDIDIEGDDEKLVALASSQPVLMT